MNGNTLTSTAADEAGAASSLSGTVTYTRPFRLSDGTPIAIAVTGIPGSDDRVVAAVIDLEKLSERLLGARGETAGAVSAVDGSSTVVIASDPSRLLTDAVAEPVHSSSDARFGTADIEGTETALSQAQVNGSDWTVMNTEPTASTYALRDAVSRRILVLLGVLIVGIATIGMPIGRNTVTALDRRSRGHH